MNGRILIIEDDPEIADLVAIHLRDLNFELDRAADGAEGLRRAVEGDYRLVILDLMLPELDGLEVCKRLRREKEGLPILMLTARSEEFDKVLGLELGADDYLTKPFSVRELMARVKALLRRASRPVDDGIEEGGGSEIRIHDLRIELEKRRVSLDDGSGGEREIELTPKEFDLLVLFASHPGRVFSRDELLNKVWGYQFEGYGHTVNSHINRLRAKIESEPSEPRLITTVWGVGYRFAEPEAAEA
ncbi:MAG: response regulator transcription factor [Candidatus Eiseniibacteriota bacterium]|jgi:DNA-binding response OmpR family regulator